MGRGRRCMGYSAAGSVMAPGRGSSPGCRRSRMRPGRSAGRSASIPRCAGRISMRLVPGGRGTGSVSRRAGPAAPSLLIMGWAARAGACPPRSIWRVSSTRSRWRFVTAGQRGDSPQFQAVLERIRVPRPGRGRPRTRPRRVLADKAYGSRANRSYLRRRGIRCTIPDKADQVRNRKNKGSAGGRPPAFDPELYKQRHAVETSKPQCCHIRGSLESSSAASSSGLMPAC